MDRPYFVPSPFLLVVPFFDIPVESGAVLPVTDVAHRWALTVIHYPRNTVIYDYPPIGVTFMVILYFFIFKYYPNLFSNYDPKYTIWVIYPSRLNFGEFIYKVTFPETLPDRTRGNENALLFWYHVSDRYNDFQ